MRDLYNSSMAHAGHLSWPPNVGASTTPTLPIIPCAYYDDLGAAGILNRGATVINNVNIDVVGDSPLRGLDTWWR